MNPTYDFASFGLHQMIESSHALRLLGAETRCMEESAREIVDFLYESFADPLTGQPACALVRCFKTHPFRDLSQPLRDAAQSAAPGSLLDPAASCLTLLATRGVEPRWNSRHTSSGHRSIPLATPEMLHQAPMIARIVYQFGLQPIDITHATAETREALERRALDVFHVEHARGSVFVPAQSEFVIPFGVRSVLGFGGLLPSGELFFVVMFATVHIPPETAAMFRTHALCVKLVLLRHMNRQIFAA